MSVTFSAVFESDVPPYGTLGPDHLVLAAIRDRLDRLAAAHGLTSLLAFESYDPADSAGLVDDEALAAQPPAESFAASAGVAAVNALYGHLDAHPGVFVKQAGLMEALSDLGDELEAAGRAGVRFRFAVVM